MPPSAYVEELDDNDEPVRRTRRTAEKKVEIKRETQNSERRLASRKEKDKNSNDSRRANANSSPPPPKRVETKPSTKQERRKSSSHTTSPKKPSTRPPSVHNNAMYPQVDPIRSIPQPVYIQRAITHPHSRPSSFHEGMSYHAYGPPLSSSAYYVAPNNSLMPAPSYPPPSPLGGYMALANGTVYHPNNGGSLPPPFRQDYSTPAPQSPPRTLEERLGGTARRRSIAYTSTGPEDRGYDSAYERSVPVVRKPSLRKTRAQLDSERMPPPPSRRRNSVRYADEENFDDELFEPRSRPIYQDERAQSRQRRPSMNRYPDSYTYGSGNEVRIEPERNVDRSRRNSYYGPPVGAPVYAMYNVPVAEDFIEDKLHAAENYQNSVGGPPARLTAESLKRASSRRAHPASNSTRSSGSHDDSERQRSSVTTRTTGTTRTGAGDEDITIRLKGQGKIKIAGAEIDYDKDTELNIRRGNGGGGGGSQRSSDYGGSDERRDRSERLSDRSRISSNARHSGERRYSRA